MPNKRKPSGPVSGSSPYAKRSRPSYAEDEDADEMTPAVTPYERPRNHPVYGQRSAFPGLDVEVEDELFYGPAEDGMEYLRMVRSEANSLPFLFTAPKTTQPAAKKTIEVDESEKQQQQQRQQQQQQQQQEGENPELVLDGAYADGVYFATVPDTVAARGTIEQVEYSEAQSSYYNLLRHRFLLLRSILKCTPPPATIAALDDSHPISYPRHSKTARKEWRRLLLAVDPQTVQLACMEMDSVLGVLGIMARLMSENVRSGDAERVRRIGAWAWGLLGKCRELGQLETEDVGDIRDLGKRAVKILHKMQEEDEKKRSVLAHDGDLSNEESDDDENPEDAHVHAENVGEDSLDSVKPAQDAEMEQPVEDLEAAKARLQAMLQVGEDETISVEIDTPEASSNELEPSAEGSGVDVAMQTRAMLDMIITIVGEFYGQRDLLRERELWDDSMIPVNVV